jgi:hypothetical protein
MALTIRLAALLAVSSAMGLAETWSGMLVDSKCYAAEERNVNPTDTETFVDRDKGYEIRYCSPKLKTKIFALVPPYGESVPLDSAGNAKAAQLIRTEGKKHLVLVTITGELIGNAIQVDSIAALPTR